MSCPCKKRALAGIVAACGAVIVLGGGFVASMLSFNTAMDSLGKQLEQQINAMLADPLRVAKTPQFTIALAESGSGLLSHDMTMVVVNSEDQSKFKLPFTVDVGYMGYDFTFDPVHATVNDQNFIRAYDFNQLTAFTSTGSLGLWSQRFTLNSSVSFLNDFETLAHTAARAQAFDWILAEMEKEDSTIADPMSLLEQKTQEFLPQAQENLKKVADANFIKPVGTVDFTLEADNEENVKLSVITDGFVTSSVVVSSVKFFNHSQGFTQLRSLGRSDLQIDSFAMIGKDDYDQVRNLVIHTDSSPVSAKGNFNLDFSLQVGDFDQMQNLIATGVMHNLNMSLFNSETPLLTFLEYVQQNALNVQVTEGSFDFTTKVKDELYGRVVDAVVPVTFKGEVGNTVNAVAAKATAATPAADAADAAATAAAATDTATPEAEATEQGKSQSGESPVAMVLQNPTFYTDFTFVVGENMDNIVDPVADEYGQYFKVNKAEGTSQVQVRMESDMTGSYSLVINGEKVQ